MSQFAKHNARTDTSFACPVVGRREMMKQQQAHRDRLQNMKSALDTRAPAPQPHLTLYGRDYAAKKRATTEAAFADLKMIQAIARTMTREHKIEERKGPVSLSGGKKQEIYRIMSENHKLLESIESCEPMMRTAELVKADKFRKRYIINASHTARMSGEYDDEIQRIRTEEKTKSEEYKRSAQIRLASSQRLKSSGTVSLPSLSPHGQRGSEPPTSSQPKVGKGRGGASSSGYKGAGRGQGPQPPPASPPPQPPKMEEQEEEEQMKAAPPSQDAAEPSSSSRQPVRFDIKAESMGASQAESSFVDRTKTPHAGSVDLAQFPDDEEQATAASAEKKPEAEVADALLSHAEEVAASPAEAEVAAAPEPVAASPAEVEVAAAPEPLAASPAEAEVTAAPEPVAASPAEVEVAAAKAEDNAEIEVAVASESHIEANDEDQAQLENPAVGISGEVASSQEEKAQDAQEQSFTNEMAANQEEESQDYEETFEAEEAEEETFEADEGSASKSEPSPPA